MFVTNSVHGITQVRSLALTAWPTGPVSTLLQPALASRPATCRLAEAPAASPSAARPAPRHQRPLILLIDNYDSFTYNLAHLLLSQRTHVEVIRNDEIPADQLAACALDGIVISPGPGTPADAGISIAAVSDCPRGTPLLGVCLGHQVIAPLTATITTAPQPAHGRASPITRECPRAPGRPPSALPRRPVPLAHRPGEHPAA